MSRFLDGKTVLLVVSGSIAAFKAVLVARLLQKQGARLRVVMTEGASHFVGAATFSGLTGEPVFEDPWSSGGELHVELARADLVLVAPATADLLARYAQGRASDLASAVLLCTRSPVLIAPAMHPNMWGHPATQGNVERLASFGRVRVVGPVEGEVASGESGMGRLAEPEVIVAEAIRTLTSKDLEGTRVVVTAGPTLEDLDPVRFLGNRSSGKMGYAIAERAAARGAKVTLISGPTALPTPAGCKRVDVRSAVAMRGAVWQALGPDLGSADALVMAAAVGDYRFAETLSFKQKRNEEQLSVELVQNPDILAEVGAGRTSLRPVLVGFAVETVPTEQLAQVARSKLVHKRVDLVVANRAEEAFGKDDNTALLVSQEKQVDLGTMSKAQLAERILDWLYQRLWDTAR